MKNKILDSLIILLKKLISIPSISPKDLGCQDIIATRLLSIGFVVKKINIKGTSNLWAFRKGLLDKNKTVAFVGHTDVVPIGNECDWRFPPFQPTICNGTLFGRGSVDMKGSIAAMIIAIERFIMMYPKHNSQLSLIITSDEESEAVNGTSKIVDKLMLENEKIDYCIIGEPTSEKVIGDTIKIGRRGSLTANLTIHGVQGHVAYPELAVNPIHNVIPFLYKTIKKKWDVASNFFSETNVQISEIKSGLGVSNIIPNDLFVQFNFRFGSQVQVEHLKLEIYKLLNFYNLKYSLKWTLSALPFVTCKGKLLNTVCNVLKCFNGFNPNISTQGGTSDGRFIAKMGSEIIELGLINKTIHKVNECVEISDLYKLSLIYFEIIKNLVK